MCVLDSMVPAPPLRSSHLLCCRHPRSTTKNEKKRKSERGREAEAEIDKGVNAETECSIDFKLTVQHAKKPAPSAAPCNRQNRPHKKGDKLS